VPLIVYNEWAIGYNTTLISLLECHLSMSNCMCQFHKHQNLAHMCTCNDHRSAAAVKIMLYIHSSRPMHGCGFGLSRY